MSRSNPSEGMPNPATRRFEWNGETGAVRYYDRDQKKNIDVGSEFTFLLLDELGSVGGWHDASSSAIYSNEVKDTRKDVLVVKAFKGGPLAEGLYRDIKDRAGSLGGQFIANCYIAYKDDAGALSIGVLRFKGAALGAWMDFRKQYRASLYDKAVRIHGFQEGKKGRVVFRVPLMELKDVGPETNKAATALDVALQEYLKGYFKRRTGDQAEDQPQHTEAEYDSQDYDEMPAAIVAPTGDAPAIHADDIPF